MSPAEILNRNFTKTFRGYDPVEVDAFLESLARELDELQTQLHEHEAVRSDPAGSDQLRAMEHELAEAVVAGRREAAELVARAEERAALIVTEGEAQRDTLLSGAQEEVDALQAERARLRSDAEQARAELEAWHAGIGEVRVAYEAFCERMSALASGIGVDALAAAVQ